MTRVAVVGGGPAGLAAAYRLSADADCEVHLLERAPGLGGLAAGFRQGAYTLDFGPHRLHHATHPEVLDDLRQLLGADLEVRRRRGKIWLGGRFVTYPPRPATLLQLRAGMLARIAVGLAAARFTQRSAKGSYEKAVTARVGKPMYELFYGPYAEKVWGLPGRQIAAEQADKRVNQRGLLDLLRMALGRGAGGTFLYPKYGFGQIPAAYAHALSGRTNVRIECGASVDSIEWRGEVVDRVNTLPVDHLVWSAPLPELVRRLDPPPPADVVSAARALRYRGVVLLYVALDLPRVGDADTYYFPERRVPFNRVVEQKNFSACMAPPDSTVLCLDLSCDPDDEVWAASDAELLVRVLPSLQAVGLVGERGSKQVREVFSRRFRHAYPIYDLQAAERLRTVENWLGRLANLWPIGRQGLYLHNNTHHSLLMGYRAAQLIHDQARERWPEALAEFSTFRVAD